MLATLFLLAQRGTQNTPDEGIGIGLIILAVLFVIGVAIGIFLVFSRMRKGSRQTGPDDAPHRSGHVGH